MSTSTQYQRSLVAVITIFSLVLIATYSPFPTDSGSDLPHPELAQQIKDQPLLFFQTIDINRATESDLLAIPQIGQVLAGRIIKYRTQYGPFQDLAHLKNVQGIGPKTVERLKQYCHVTRL